MNNCQLDRFRALQRRHLCSCCTAEAAGTSTSGSTAGSVAGVAMAMESLQLSPWGALQASSPGAAGADPAGVAPASSGVANYEHNDCSGDAACNGAQSDANR